MSVLKISEMRDWDIVIDPEAIPAEKHAAQEFQHMLGKSAGVFLPIRNSGEDASDHVHIGKSAALTEGNIVIDTSELGEEGFHVIIREDLLAIVGGRPRGTLYGVYQFLEDELGVRFLTYDHTHIPDRSEAQIACREYTYKPPFSFRWSYYKENSEHPEFAARLRVNTITTDERLGARRVRTSSATRFTCWFPSASTGRSTRSITPW